MKVLLLCSCLLTHNCRIEKVKSNYPTSKVLDTDSFHASGLQPQSNYKHILIQSNSYLANKLYMSNTTRPLFDVNRFDH